MNKQNSELLNTQLGTEENQPKETSSEIIKKTKVEGTPFEIVSTEDKSYIILGSYRLSEGYNTEEEAKIDIYSKTWELLVNTISAMIEHQKYLETEELKKEIQKNPL